MFRSGSIACAVIASSFVLSACGQRAEQPVAAAPATPASTETTPALPEPVNGWIEHPLADDTFKAHEASWRTDTIKIPVPANGGDLEYKLAMKKGDAVVYSTDYGKLDHAGVMVVEFHGHTEKRADGVGDLMFYSKTGGATQHGQLIAPWDGIHGWYLKNDSNKEVVVTVKLAGFYNLMEQ